MYVSYKLTLHDLAKIIGCSVEEAEQKLNAFQSTFGKLVPHQSQYKDNYNLTKVTVSDSLGMSDATDSIEATDFIVSVMEAYANNTTTYIDLTELSDADIESSYHSLLLLLCQLNGSRELNYEIKDFGVTSREYKCFYIINGTAVSFSNIDWNFRRPDHTIQLKTNLNVKPSTILRYVKKAHVEANRTRYIDNTTVKTPTSFVYDTAAKTLEDALGNVVASDISADCFDKEELQIGDVVYTDIFIIPEYM